MPTAIGTRGVTDSLARSLSDLFDGWFEERRRAVAFIVAEHQKNGGHPPTAEQLAIACDPALSIQAAEYYLGLVLKEDPHAVPGHHHPPAETVHVQAPAIGVAAAHP